MPLSKAQGAKVWEARFPEWVRACSAIHSGRYTYDGPDKVDGKVEIFCPDHGAFWQLPAKHRFGQGCPRCGGSARLAQDEAIKKLERAHPELDFSKSVYLGSKLRIAASCKIHGEFSSVPNWLRNGQGCPKCGRERAGRAVLGADTWRARFAAVHGDRYAYDWSTLVRSNAPMTARCVEHGEFHPQPQDHAKGHGCPGCGRLKANGKTRLDVAKFVADARLAHGGRYTYDEPTFLGTKADMRMVCPEHGEFWQRPNNHTQGAGCPSCVGNVSAGEREIAQFLVDLGFEVRTGVRDVLHLQELDVYLPQQRFAVEYNGLFWHREALKGKDFHLAKTEDAQAAGVRLVHIFEDEWLFKREAVKARLAHMLGVSGVRRQARKLRVYRVAWREARGFYERLHLQGAGYPATDSYALLDEDGKIVCCASFGKARFHAKFDAELLRFASDGAVTGGFQRMLQAYLRDRPGVRSIISYADRRWSTGDVYGRAGFVFLGNSLPGYAWARASERFNRHQFQKHKLPRLIKGFDAAKTEKENCEAAGYFRVFDCGVSRWVYQR